MNRVKSATVVTLLISFVAGPVHAERVGFSFEGALVGGSTGTYTLFDIPVPRNSPVSGTFSYDTTTPGIDFAPGVRNFPQSIEGGYTLDIDNGAIRISINDYIVQVADDFERTFPPETVDLFTVDFSRFNPATEPPIFVNGAPWVGTTSSTAFLRMEFSWPMETFEDVDEPKLTADRPLTPDAAHSTLIGSGSGIPRMFTISSISAIDPPEGDYNRDGAVSPADYVEWRKAFDHSDEHFLYADGNDDGMVDAADYVVWRNQLEPTGSGFGLSLAVPEPGGIALSSVALLSIGVCRRRPPRRRPAAAGPRLL